MSEKPTTEVIDPHEIADWCLQLIGGAWMAMGDHGEKPNPGRDMRAQWVGRQLLSLGRAIRALAVVATNHPEEFSKALGKPIEIELPELTQCSSRAVIGGMLRRCEQRCFHPPGHSSDGHRWTDEDEVAR